MSDDCIFCKIIEGDVPSYKVYEDENVYAFLDAEPVSKGHTLVIPKEHVDDIHGAADMDYMWEPLVKVSNAVKDAFGAEGVNIAQNNGEKAGQEVFHLHFHVTPIYEGDELDITYNRSSLESGDSVAEEISEQL
ncbi:HIT family protein [Candidatus Nanohalobium constans]|uniref:Histidine triad (HIT) family protein n=1 Tax=Candidatus Nanohalobium constans TaxID=2565781 RepID=A0A5Q0UH51_9ARCH|nr:histidine triad (HIT) family protein [Candidatus Nanohalobium constans]